MSTPNAKLTIPDRAIASVIFGFLSLFTFRIYSTLLWSNPQANHVPDKAMDIIGNILGTLETTRRVLAVVALLWCVWSWRKEWWLPSLIATLSTALTLFIAFFIDS